MTIRNFKPLHLSWGIGTLGASLLLNGFAFVALFYLTTELGIAAALAGTLIGASKVWDAVFNPLMGWISDRTETRWGRRRPFLLAGALVASVAFAAFYSTPRSLSPDATLIYAGCMLVLIGTGYTIFNVPYMAMPAEMISSYHERSLMMSYRVFFIGVGTFVGGGAARKIVELAGGGAEGYATFGVTIGLGIFICMVLCFLGTRDAPFTRREMKETLPIGEQWRLGFANRPFVLLLGVKFTQLLGLASATSTVLFVLRFVMQKPNPGDWMLMYVGASSLLQIVTIPIWLALSRRYEKRATYMFATIVFSLATLSWLLVTPEEPAAFFILRAAVKGFAAAGLLLMGQSMLPDTIEYDYRRTGLRREGIFSGLYSFVEKAAFAFGPMITGLVLAYFGFLSKAPTQTPEALSGILVAAGVLPAIYFALSLPLLLRYELTEARLKATTRPQASQA
jgi:GPH family glycoside/pentoside/hexuronide:cation symporter